MTGPEFTIRNRAELVDALSVAAQVEHVVLLEYLYAAFSCRHTQDPALPPGVQLASWELANRLYLITHEEMDHLGAIQQLLAALGAPPVPDAWGFPVDDPRLPFPVELTRLSLAALDRFIATESPAVPFEAALPEPPDAIRFDVLGDLYRAIVAALQDLGDPVFLGSGVVGEDPSPLTFRQNGMPVANAAQAVATITGVIQEGEGSSGADPRGHWQRFTAMRGRLAGLGADAELVSWPCVTNPVLVDTGRPNTTLLTDPVTVAVADIANRAYRALWLLLGGSYLHDWSAEDEDATVDRRQTQRFTSMLAARWMMAAAVRPLGEIMARLPAFAEQPDGPTAGACFEQYGEFRVPAQPDARKNATLDELSAIATDLAAVAADPALAAPWAGPRLAALAQDVGTIRERLAGRLGQPPRTRFEPAQPGPWLSVDFDGWYQARLATGGDPYNDPRGVSGWQFAYPGEPDLDRIIRFHPAGTFLRPHLDPGITIGVTISSATVDAGPELPGVAGGVVDLLDDPVFEGHNGVIAGDGDEPIVPLRLRIAGGGLVLERSALDEYRLPYLEQTSLGPAVDAEAPAETLRAKYGLGSNELPDRIQAAVDRLTQAITDTPAEDQLTRRILTDRRRRIGPGAFFFTVAWRLRLTGTDAVAQVPDGVPAPASDQPWWLELLSTGFDPDAGCALVRGVLHAPLPRPDGSVSAGPPPWRMELPVPAPEAVPSMPVDAMGVRPGRGPNEPE
ncbi:MAG TPA: ferritin-like domain-containing protein [Pseudonocardia sp.]|nr:ferritin-like domain-containing protein [Pseudonocardia sp.]